MMTNLSGRVAIVTGGSSGIGNEIATTLGEHGATVVIADIEAEPELADETPVMDRLQDCDAEGRFIETNVKHPEEAAHAVAETIANYGSLDILVNNAGIYRRYELHNTPDEEWHEMLDVNLGGVYNMCKAAIPELRESDGAKIVNISSISGLVGSAKSAAYCASKGGVTNLTRQLATDYSKDGINVNAIAPGLIKTAQNVEWRENNPDMVEDWERSTLLPRFGEPEDIAQAALFLTSDRSDYITGEVLRVDGGMGAH